MKVSPKKVIKLNKIRPTTGFNMTALSFDRDSQPQRIARSLGGKDYGDATSFQVSKDFTGSSQKIKLQSRAFQNKPFEGQKTKKLLKFELKCEDLRCDQDSNTVMSYGGYSVQSIQRKNPGIHNHRKLNQITVYDYLEDEVPQILEDLLQSNLKKELQGQIEQKNSFPYPRVGKVNWKVSPFAPMFVNNNPQLQSTTLQRHIENQQIRKKKQLQKYELERQIELEKKKKRQVKKVFKTDTKLEPKVTDIILSPDKEKMRTRLMEKEQALSGFEVSHKAQPGNQGKYCYPCRTKFQDYWAHIKLTQHKLACRKSIGSEFFMDQMRNMEKNKKDEMSLEDYKYLVELEIFLRGVVENVQAIMFKKNIEMKEKLRQINHGVQQWAKQ